DCSHAEDSPPGHVESPSDRRGERKDGGKTLVEVVAVIRQQVRIVDRAVVVAEVARQGADARLRIGPVAADDDLDLDTGRGCGDPREEQETKCGQCRENCLQAWYPVVTEAGGHI